MSEVKEFELPAIYHRKLDAWQKANFPDLALLDKYWEKHFPNERPFVLNVKLDEMAPGTIEYGMYKGAPKIDQAREMKGNMLYSALRIIKAQCSTELGSVQQHVCTLDTTGNDATKFKILRVMAEEFRHAYQMFWVLAHDPTWSAGGIEQLADNTMDELLAMHTGSHVLDAFNIPFIDALDNVVFAFLIDRVGKYQLTMQKAFAYTPMANSMSPMLREESFHLKFGFEVLRDIAVEAAVGNGRWSLNEIQRRLNAWVPRGLEMFGNPAGGDTNLEFSFKDRLNGPAAEAYYQENERLVEKLNVAITRARHPDLDEEAAKALNRERPADDLLTLPDPEFFRTRGPDELSLQLVDVAGKRLDNAQFEPYLASVLPRELLATDFFQGYRAAFQAKHQLAN